MGLREPAAADTERVSELVESSMTSSHSLSPQQIDQIVEEVFGEDAMASKMDDQGTVVRVAETTEDVDEETVVGYVEGTLDGEWGELRWLFVDPEHRGRGIGTELYESMTDALHEAGADDVRATTLEANTEGHQFFERFGLERADERRVDVGDESLVEYVYADPDADLEMGDREGGGAQAEESPAEAMPETETQDGTTTATTGDGERVYVARDEEESGTEASFYVTYTDEAHEERFGYYCSNCGSLDVSMDDMDRIECDECGNTHAPRSGESYDDSYL
ncbi:GNAT family N-acetyltransferase [Halobacterium wangiae]|uniref:GNAT family N-acetyltransferase n=1 Tax=Halobacterium wangiae TaxID=2902623 RepID=UPI001E2D9BAE|nr:GNAT family N-acetyltransferase [Halobacterium wangiae]